MKKIILIFVSLLCFGCENNSESIIVKSLIIDQYNFRNMDYSTSVLGDGIVKLNYQDSKIVKRIGALSILDPASGFNFVFNQNLFEEIIYSQNLITITRKINSTSQTVNPDLETITLNNDNKMISKVRERFGLPTETEIFLYDASNLLKESNSGDKTTINGGKNAKYYYNSNKNLDSIVTINYSLNVLKTKRIQTFTNYDYDTNYTKNLFLFDETFYRSLSKNNYKKYTSKTFDEMNNLIENDFRTYDFQYDNNGKLIY